MTRLVWTKTPPSEPGYFWFRQWLDADSFWNVKGVGHWESPRIGEIHDARCPFPLNCLSRPGARTEWAGPIAPPEEHA
jgi:hypothetical protein